MNFAVQYIETEDINAFREAMHRVQSRGISCTTSRTVISDDRTIYRLYVKGADYSRIA